MIMPAISFSVMKHIPLGFTRERTLEHCECIPGLFDFRCVVAALRENGLAVIGCEVK